MDQKEVTAVVTEGHNSMDDSKLPPHLADSRVETLLLEYTGWSGSKAEIKDSNTQEVLYSVQYKLRRPHLIMQTPGSIENFAGVTYHLTKTRIDIDVQGQSLELKSKSLWSRDCLFVSPAFQNQTMTWTIKCRALAYDCICLDEQQTAVARFVADPGWGKKIGKIELLGQTTDNANARAEILATGLALVYYLTIVTRSAVVA